MDAVEYIKEAKRICKSRSVCKSVSDKCPLLDENGHCTATADICAADIIEKAEKAVQIVEQWAKDHPVKTRQSEFLKMFPHAQKRDGIINICPLSVDKDHKTNSECLITACDGCRQRFWNEEVTDNGND